MKRKGIRKRNEGHTYAAIRSSLQYANTIPELDQFIRRNRLRVDITIKTAIKHLIEDGVIEMVKKPYSCYDAVQYRLKDGAK